MATTSHSTPTPISGLSLIACVSADLGLGYGNDLLWRFKADQQFFRRTTMGHPVAMGSRTYASIGRLLPGRDNLILSREPLVVQGARVFSSAEDLTAHLRQLSGEKFIIGGASLYQLYLPLAEKLILTEVAATKPADVFFPQFSPADYTARELASGTFDGIPYRTIEYLRRTPASLRKHL